MLNRRTSAVAIENAVENLDLQNESMCRKKPDQLYKVKLRTEPATA